MLKERYKKQLIKLFNDLIQYACDNAAYVDSDTNCDCRYVKDIDRFEDRFNIVLKHLNNPDSYKSDRK